MSTYKPHRPYSVGRLVRMCRTWDFHSDFDALDAEDGEPFTNRAFRRVRNVLAAWRDSHPPDDDPAFDETTALFQVSDVAVLWDECRRLWHLEERVVRALGPPCRSLRWNKKTNKLEEGDEQ